MAQYSRGNFVTKELKTQHVQKEMTVELTRIEKEAFDMARSLVRNPKYTYVSDNDLQVRLHNSLCMFSQDNIKYIEYYPCEWDTKTFLRLKVYFTNNTHCLSEVFLGKTPDKNFKID